MSVYNILDDSGAATIRALSYFLRRHVMATANAVATTSDAATPTNIIYEAEFDAGIEGAKRTPNETKRAT